MGRRQALQQINKPLVILRKLVPVVVSGVISYPEETAAAEPQSLGEAIRRSATQIPGYGPTDVFFPGQLLGTWNMTKEIDFLDDKEVLRVAYRYRFIASVEDDSVVADRGFNQAQLESAVIQSFLAASDQSPISSYEWQYTNPNDLRLSFSSGGTKEIKVTKRATELNGALISTSEFQRVTQQGPRGIPEVSARRVVTKWRIVDESRIEGLEVIFSMPGGDPLAGMSKASSPQVLSKSRMVLIR